MKTVGEILKSKRLEKGVELVAVESQTKIRKKFLEAIEADEWTKLPSITYGRGFIKNYAQFLGIDTAYVLSIFRRQLVFWEKQKVLPTGVTQPLNDPYFKITPQKIMAIFVSLLFMIFFVWLFGQYRGILVAPKITLLKPIENEVIKSDKTIISGKIDEEATLTLNGQEIEVKNNKFEKEISVSSGTVVLTLEAINKFGKKTELKRTISVETP